MGHATQGPTFGSQVEVVVVGAGVQIATLGSQEVVVVVGAVVLVGDVVVH